MKLVDCSSIDEHNTYVNNASYVLLDFSAKWCGPCKSILPQLQYLQHQRQDVLILTVDADEAPELCQMYKVTSLPTFVYIVQGKVVDQFSSADPNQLVSLFNQYFPVLQSSKEEQKESTSMQKELPIMKEGIGIRESKEIPNEFRATIKPFEPGSEAPPKKLTTLQKIHAARKKNTPQNTLPLHDEENITQFPITHQPLSLKDFQGLI